MYHAYFGMLIGAVQQVLSVFPALAQGADAIRSLGEILEAPEIERNDWGLEFRADMDASPATRALYERRGFRFPTVADGAWDR